MEGGGGEAVHNMLASRYSLKLVAVRNAGSVLNVVKQLRLLWYANKSSTEHYSVNAQFQHLCTGGDYH